MRKLHPSIRYPLALLLSALPFVLNAVFWRSGGVDEILWFFPALVLLTWGNYRCAGGPLPFLLLQLFLIPCAFLSCEINTELYYRHIGQDFETLMVGELISWIEIISVAVITIPCAIGKAKAGR